MQTLIILFCKLHKVTIILDGLAYVLYSSKIFQHIHGRRDTEPHTYHGIFLSHHHMSDSCHLNSFLCSDMYDIFEIYGDLEMLTLLLCGR